MNDKTLTELRQDRLNVYVGRMIDIGCNYEQIYFTVMGDYPTQGGYWLLKDIGLNKDNLSRIAQIIPLSEMSEMESKVGFIHFD